MYSPNTQHLVSDGQEYGQDHFFKDDGKSSSCRNELSQMRPFPIIRYAFITQNPITDCNPGYHFKRRTICLTTTQLIQATLTRGRQPHDSPLPLGISFRNSHPNSSSGFSGSIPKHER